MMMNLCLDKSPFEFWLITLDILDCYPIAYIRYLINLIVPILSLWLGFDDDDHDDSPLLSLHFSIKKKYGRFDNST